MLFQIEQLDAKGIRTIFDSVFFFFFFILGKYIFSSIFYAILFSYSAFVMLPLKIFCSFLLCAIVYAEICCCYFCIYIAQRNNT